MADKEIYISKDGLEKIKAEVAEIEGTKLKEIAKKIAEAKDMGDLSENAEYHEAKQTQAFLFGRAQELKYKIKHAKIIRECNGGATCTVGCTVTVKDKLGEMQYSLVGSEEADPLAGRISIESPIGASLLGHKPGESVEVSTPAGTQRFEIVSIK